MPMHVTWDKRGKSSIKYYAYLRYSKSVEGKIKTLNVYLGNTMTVAQKKLISYCKENKIKPDSYLRELHAKALNLDLPKDTEIDCKQLEQERINQWHKIRDLVDSIPAAKTIAERKALKTKLTVELFEYEQIIHECIK